MRWLFVLRTPGLPTQYQGVVMEFFHTDSEVWPTLDLYRSTPAKLTLAIKLTLAKILNLGINTE